MPKLKLKKSLARVNYVKQLIQKVVCEVKELADYADHKTNPQLVNDVMNFIEQEISSGKYANEQFEKYEILQEVYKTVYEMNDDDIVWLASHAQFLLDNKLVKKKHLLKKGIKLISYILLGASKDL